MSSEVVNTHVGSSVGSSNVAGDSIEKKEKKKLGTWEQAKKKLITKEDGNHLHKTLGGLVLLSFIYRYFIVYPMIGTLGFEDGLSIFNLLTMFLHISLSCSSLIFHVLTKRLINRPMIIWEEYRQHAIVFSLRAFSVYLFGVFRPFRPENGWNENVEYLALYCLVMFHHLIVDDITRRHGSTEHTTVRVKDSFSFYTTIILRFYAFYQMIALAGFLIPNNNLVEISFNTLIAIQSSAFLMTLYRKNLISGMTHGIWYTSALIISAFHIFRVYGGTSFLVKAIGVFIFRTQFRFSKYFVWFLFSMFSTPWFWNSIYNEFAYYLEILQYFPVQFADLSLPTGCLVILLAVVYKVIHATKANNATESTK